MTNIVYLQAHVKDTEIRKDLNKFYNMIKSGRIEGLKLIKLILRKTALDDLAKEYSIEFQTAINQANFSGLALWTEWEESTHIDKFYRSQLHRQFVEYARLRLDRATYRITQLRNDKVTVRDIK